ncbi:MlaD family protein [Subsaxibacter sp. CAU 1640]|uniref:MlaD family protein n=1 Tax=Subsaxibacter sp. CAU 1640 TaxID=2933271 RepID=UPI0020054FC6|nr:MlaD family protein [Subsaxibacter sp. CAU 1640]MCK7590914.1 MlaD family protein [Subsaxibacter sp. CAU 1640]
MKISREVKTAILVISGIVLMIFLFNYLKGINLLDSNAEYHTTFDYNALDSSAPVTIKGNKIGKIASIEYDTKTGKTKVTISVRDDIKFSKNSKIKLYETGLMGGNGLAIVPEPGTELAESGDYLESTVEAGLIRSLTENFSGISSNLGNTMQSADTLLINLNKLVIDDSEEGLKRTIAELNATIISFNKLSGSINSLVSKNDEQLTSAIKNFNTVTSDLAVLSNDLKDVKLSESIAKLENTLESVNTLMADVKNGNGTLGKLMTDDKLYDNLEGASKQLEQLLQDFKLNPKRYVHFSVFGKKPGKFDAEENIIEDEKTQPENN